MTVTDLDALIDASAAQPAPAEPERDELDRMIDATGPKGPSLTIGEMFPLINRMDFDMATSGARKPRGFMESVTPGASDVPFVGYGFQLADIANQQSAIARWSRGDSTREDQRLVLQSMVERARGSSFGGGVGSILKGLGTFGGEMMAGAGVASVAGKGAVASARKIASEALAEGAQRAMQSKVAQLTASGAATLGMQEGVPQGLGMEGGAWTLQAVQRTLADSGLTDEEAQAIGDDLNAAIPALLSRSDGLLHGFIAQAIEVGAESTGGVVGKLPPFAIVNAAIGGIMRKIAGRSPKGKLSERIAELARFDGPGSEIGEEFLGAVADAAILGDTDIPTAISEVTDNLPEMLVALSIPGAGMALKTRIADSFSQKAAIDRGEQSTDAGSDPASKGGDIPAASDSGSPVTEEGAAPPIPLAADNKEGVEAPNATHSDIRTPEAVEAQRDADVAAFSEALGGAEVQRVEPQSPSDQAVATFLESRGIGVTFVESAEELPASGFHADTGREVIVAGSDRGWDIGIHEAGHTVEDSMAPDEVEVFRGEVESASPGFWDRAQSAWRSRTELPQADQDAVADSEELATGFEIMAPAIWYAQTEQGAQDVARIATENPGLARQIWDRVVAAVEALVGIDPSMRSTLTAAKKRAARYIGSAPTHGEAQVAQAMLGAIDSMKGRLAEDGGPSGTGAPRFAPAAPLDSPAFKKWFRDSKVVDSDGRPLVVYHGTGSAFTSPNGMTWGASSPSLANEYALMRQRGFNDRGGQVMPFYMAIRHPLDGDSLPLLMSPGEFLDAANAQAGGALAPEDVSKIGASLANRALEEEAGSRFSPHEFWNTPHFHFGADGASELKRALVSMGFDGIQYTERGGLTFGAFSPSQIKSATGNRGTFDGSNPDIRFAPGGSSAGPGIPSNPQAAQEELGGAAPLKPTLGRKRPGAVTDQPSAPSASGEKRKTFTQQDVPTAEKLAAKSSREGDERKTVGRSDLNIPAEDAKARDLINAVDELRKADHKVQSRKANIKKATELVRDYPDAARDMVADKVASASQMSPIETVIAARVGELMTEQGLAGDTEAMVDAMNWWDGYRESRANTARTLGAVVGIGIPASVETLEKLLRPTRSGQRRQREISKEVPDWLRQRVQRAAKRRPLAGTKKAMGRVAGSRRVDTKRKLFAPIDFSEMVGPDGRPISKERIAYLEAEAAKYDKQQAEMAKKIIDALAGVMAEQGLAINDLSMDHMLDPFMRSKIIKAAMTAKARWQDKSSEYLLASMLSGPITHARNLFGNVSNLVLEGPVQLFTEAVVNTVGRQGGAASVSEIGPYAKEFLKSVWPAVQNSWIGWRTGSPSYGLALARGGADLGTFGSKLDALDGPAMSSKLGGGLRAISLDLLTAGDELFKTIAGNSMGRALSYRYAKAEGLHGAARKQRADALFNDKSSPMWTEAFESALKVTFQNEGGELTQKAKRVAFDIRGALQDVLPERFNPMLGILMFPFINTPVNIAATAIRRTPLQTFTVLGRAIRRQYKGDTALLVKDLADSAIAWSLAFAIHSLVDDYDEEGRPRITGSRPSNYKETELWRRLGIGPMSLRVGDEYLSFATLEPASTSLGILVDTARAFSDGDGWASGGGAFLKAAAAQTKDKTFLRTVGDLMSLAGGEGDSETRLARFAQRSLATPWVPNIIRSTARSSDPLRREYAKKQDDESVWWTLGRDTLYRALPIAANAPEPKRDLWGREIRKEFGGDTLGEFGLRMVLPTISTGDVDTATKADLLLFNYNRRVNAGDLGDARGYMPGKPRADFTHQGKKYRMTPAEYDQLLRTGGEQAIERIEGLIDAGRLNYTEPSEADMKQLRKIRDAANRSARKAVIRDHLERLDREAPRSR